MTFPVITQSRRFLRAGTLKPGMLIWLYPGAYLFEHAKWGYINQEYKKSGQISIIPAACRGDTWSEAWSTGCILSEYKIKEKEVAMVMRADCIESEDDFKIELLIRNQVYLVWGSLLGPFTEVTHEGTTRRRP